MKVPRTMIPFRMTRTEKKKTRRRKKKNQDCPRILIRARRHRSREVLFPRATLCYPRVVVRSLPFKIRPSWPTPPFEGLTIHFGTLTLNSRSCSPNSTINNRAERAPLLLIIVKLGDEGPNLDGVPNWPRTTAPPATTTSPFWPRRRHPRWIRPRGINPHHPLIGPLENRQDWAPRPNRRPLHRPTLPIRLSSKSPPRRRLPSRPLRLHPPRRLREVTPPRRRPIMDLWATTNAPPPNIGVCSTGFLMWPNIGSTGYAPSVCPVE